MEKVLMQNGSPRPDGNLALAFHEMEQVFDGIAHYPLLSRRNIIVSATVSQIMESMIAFSDGNIRDINHFICVWSYAKTIGELEKLDRDTQFILEVAAITHDIACPLCRRKYGNAGGKLQEREGDPLVRSFLSDKGLTEAQIERVAFLVGHHHTLAGIEGLDWQILVEADYIVNAAENGYSPQNIEHFIESNMKTESGKRLARSVFCLDKAPED